MTDETQSSQQAASAPRQMNWWRRILMAILGPVLAALIRIVWVFYRFELEESESFLELERRQQPVVLAIWHETILAVTWYVAQLLKRGVKATFLISPSVDGEIGAVLLAQFGSQAVRGSSRRSAAAALAGLHRAITERGQSPFITLDGSKGPWRVSKKGAIKVARGAGVPIIPIGLAASRSRRARTWDHHLLPMPFSKIAITVGEPIAVPQEMTDDDVEARRRALEEEMNRMMGICEERLGVRGATRSADAGRPEEEP
jgi:lysophospholipid acyltransferase (LPLAT)-like uncharacterized protein